MTYTTRQIAAESHKSTDTVSIVAVQLLGKPKRAGSARTFTARETARMLRALAKRKRGPKPKRRRR